MAFAVTDLETSLVCDWEKPIIIHVILQIQSIHKLPRTLSNPFKQSNDNKQQRATRMTPQRLHSLWRLSRPQFDASQRQTPARALKPSRARKSLSTITTIIVCLFATMQCWLYIQRTASPHCRCRCLAKCKATRKEDTCLANSHTHTHSRSGKSDRDLSSTNYLYSAQSAAPHPTESRSLTTFDLSA